MSVLDSLKEYSALFYTKSAPSYERALLKEVNLNNRIIGIVGAKGVGKTTLLLQFMKKQALNTEEMMYISVDHPLMSTVSILDIAKEFASMGGKLLILDEIHNQPDFDRDLKTIWDFLEINILFSGSSAMHLDNADLSRRVLKYKLPTLSFREFLEIETGLIFNRLSLSQLLTEHTTHCTNILAQIKPLKYFKAYLDYGYYPFYLEDKLTFKVKLSEAINKTIDVDLLQIYHIDPKKIRNIKKILTMLCVSVPYKPNISSLAQAVEVDPKTLYSYLNALQSARIIKMVSLQSRGESIIKKPEKIYLDNPNLFKALCQTPDIGSIRESFFVSSVNHAGLSVNASQKGDFFVNDQFVFEVGGKDKGYKQIKQLDNGFIAADNIEIGHNNGKYHKIPLWLFGFLY